MPMTPNRARIAIYARHSTDKQNPASSSDQAAACRKLVDLLNGRVVGTYLDPEESGYKRDRPELKRLLADVASGSIDIIVAESLDRVARDAEDVAFLGKKLGYHCVKLHTATEGLVDEIKFAVAGMLGTIFLKNLQDKTIRGMQAAILAGRFAGGRAYGYVRAHVLDAAGQPVRGVLEIAPAQAEIVRRIYREFAAGRSPIDIATRLNAEAIPAPRGEEWNASTIRGDPKKLVGILNNPLYEGRLVWGRRQWRKNPDSERRERRYRLRDRSEWLEVAVPDLRIVNEQEWSAVREEMTKRQRSTGSASPAGKPRKIHILSGLIRCNSCGSNYVISGKDYYRCAGQKDRGTCSNKLSVRKGSLEAATLSVLQSHLLTEQHARHFADEYRREAERMLLDSSRSEDHLRAKLERIDLELENLSKNALAGLISPTIMRMISEREKEKEQLQGEIADRARRYPPPQLPSHEQLLARFKTKVATIREALNDETVRREASETIGQLIEAVTIFPDSQEGPQAEVSASIATLASFAAHPRGAPELGPVSSSMALVAGAGFEPATFRL